MNQVDVFADEMPDEYAPPLMKIISRSAVHSRIYANTAAGFSAQSLRI